MTRALMRPALYRQLSVRLLVPLLLIVAIVGTMGLYSVSRQTEEVFDRWLLDAAVSLAGQVRSDAGGVSVDLPEAARAMLAYDEIDRTSFMVANGGKLLAGRAGIPATGPNEVAYGNGRAFDARFEGERVRVAAATATCRGCEGVEVLVAETTRKRQRAARVVLWLVVPLLLMLGITCSAIVLTVRRSVRPLEVLAEHWNRQSHTSLRPIPEGGLPRELAPFATALNDLLARLRAILERERMFAAAAAHQLRTPLTAVRLGLARARHSPDLDSTRAVLDELAHITQHTGRLVQQLLLLGRLDPEAGGDIERAPVDLRDVARDVCGLFADVALERAIDLELRVPEQAVVVHAQSELLVEALANLIDNALHATSGHGAVIVEVTMTPPGLRVGDSGPGVRPDEREAIFERHVRGAAATWQGTGLGLSIVRDIATLHGAKVDVSDAPQGGAQFGFVFAASQVPGGTASEGRPGMTE
jgi:two-component system sensor histidine kinase TctE